MKKGGNIFKGIIGSLYKILTQNYQKEIIKLIKEVSTLENKEELMSLYLTHFASPNPLKRIRQCEQCKIANDIIKIEEIMKNPSNGGTLEKIHLEKYESRHITEKIKNINGLIGISELIKQEEKNIEIAFALKTIEEYYDFKCLMFLITILLFIVLILELGFWSLTSPFFAEFFGKITASVSQGVSIYQ